MPLKICLEGHVVAENSAGPGHGSSREHSIACAA
jgi:hypothetical protein